MKGIELPINILIIIAVAVIVLIAVIAMFYPTFTKGGGAVTLDVAKSAACRALIANGCIGHANLILTTNFDANKDGRASNSLVDGGASCGTGATSGDHLWSLCVCQLGLDQNVAGCAQCKVDICGCTQNSAC